MSSGSTKPSLRNPSISSTTTAGTTSVLPLPGRPSPALSHSPSGKDAASTISSSKPPNAKCVVLLISLSFVAILFLLFGSTTGKSTTDVTTIVTMPTSPPQSTLSDSQEAEKRRKLEELGRNLGINLAQLAGESQELAAQRLHIGKGSFGNSVSTSDLHAAQYFDVDNVVFSCFYNNDWVNHVPSAGGATREGFYVGKRKIPSLDWIEVFIRSVADVTATPEVRESEVHNNIKRGVKGNEKEILNPSPLEEATIGDNRTRLVLFVDFMTWKRLRPLVADVEFRPFSYLHKEIVMRKRSNVVADLHQKNANGDADTPYSMTSSTILRRPLVQFIVVAFPKDEALLLAGLETIPMDQYPDIVLPSYLDSKWAADVRNGANNFRFALYRDWLSRYNSHMALKHTESWTERLAQAKKEDAMENNKRNKAEGELSEEYTPYSEVDALLDLKIAVVDATDVAFQRNPFRTDGGCFGHPKAAEATSRQGLKIPLVIATLENSKMTFKKEKFNRKWMSCFDNGKDLNRLAKAQRPIACAGVTLGNGAGMFSYFTAQLLQIVRPSLVQCALNVISAALDQATHNYLLHTLTANSGVTDLDLKLLGSSSDALLAAKGNDGHRSKQSLSQEEIETARKLLGSLAHFPVPPPEETLDAKDPENPLPFAKKASLPVSVLLTNHEHDHCTFHGNFGKLKTIPVDASEVGEGTGGEEKTILAVNPEGKVYDIVHQYSSDRHPPLMAALSSRYLKKKNRK